MFYVGLLLLLLFSVFLFKGVHIQGWLTEKITSDSLKVTSDKKYEYRIDLINVFQKNSRGRLYVKNVASGEEMSIPIDIHTSRIVGLGIKKVNNWVMIEPTDESSRYILYTTKELGIPEEKFEIDVGTSTSRRLE